MSRSIQAAHDQPTPRAPCVRCGRAYFAHTPIDEMPLHGSQPVTTPSATVSTTVSGVGPATTTVSGVGPATASANRAPLSLSMQRSTQALQPPSSQRAFPFTQPRPSMLQQPSAQRSFSLPQPAESSSSTASSIATPQPRSISFPGMRRGGPSSFQERTSSNGLQMAGPSTAQLPLPALQPPTIHRNTLIHPWRSPQHNRPSTGPIRNSGELHSLVPSSSVAGKSNHIHH